MFGFIRAWKRKRLARKPFPESWEPILEEHFPFEGELDPDERERFRDHLKVFVWEKYWIGARDLDITDEMKVVIAGSAAKIARNLPLDIYDRLTEIVVYPSHFKHPDDEDDHVATYGEAHHWGTVVLSWDAVEKGVSVRNDGRDTAVHEFAHVLDIADGWFDGTPQLEKGSDYSSWSRVLGEHFERLKDAPGEHVLREYGAINEAEFFAVATEAFFEKPKVLRRKAPDLFDELKNFFGTDPSEH